MEKVIIYMLNRDQVSSDRITVMLDILNQQISQRHGYANIHTLEECIIQYFYLAS